MVQCFQAVCTHKGVPFRFTLSDIALNELAIYPANGRESASNDGSTVAGVSGSERMDGHLQHSRDAPHIDRVQRSRQVPSGAVATRAHLHAVPAASRRRRARLRSPSSRRARVGAPSRRQPAVRVRAVRRRTTRVRRPGLREAAAEDLHYRACSTRQLPAGEQPAADGRHARTASTWQPAARHPPVADRTAQARLYHALVEDHPGAFIGKMCTKADKGYILYVAIRLGFWKFQGTDWDALVILIMNVTWFDL